MAKSSTVQSPDVWLLEPMIVQDAVGLERGWRVDDGWAWGTLGSGPAPGEGRAFAGATRGPLATAVKR